VIRNVPYVSVAGVLPIRQSAADLFFKPGHLAISQSECLHVQTLGSLQQPLCQPERSRMPDSQRERLREIVGFRAAE